MPVFWLFVLKTAPSRRIGWFRAVAFTPIALSGLIAYMAYQYAAFDDGLAFVRTQEHWCRREGVSTGEKVQALLSYEPIWSVYDPGDWGYWRRQDSKLPAAVSLSFANPIYFLLGGALLVIGVWKRWLNGRESLLGVLLLLIPYVTRSYEMCMLSQGRFIAANFLIYLVMGRLLNRIPGPVAAFVLCVAAVYLEVYAGQFAAGYLLI